MFVAIDGEGYTVEDTDEHRYNLMASSLGNSIYDEAGLRTVDCFDFLLRTKRAAGRKSTLVGFAINYDINMMLRDISKAKLAELWMEGITKWYHFNIKWLPSKFFGITNRRTRQSVLVYDTFGFFQSSFIKALNGWDVEAPEQIEQMKQKRSQFTDDMRESITSYCHLECDALVTLMERLKESLHSVGLRTSRWHGAGAIAASLLKREGVDKHVQPDETYGDLLTPIMHAYFGGRTELFRQGHFDHLYNYDIRSAYPAACRNLPSLAGATFRRDRNHVPRSDVISLHHVRWRTDSEAYIQPFPFRYRRAIYYPCEGEGYYWSCEVEQAQKVHGSNIEILDGWVLSTPNSYRPFHFIDPIYEERAQLKREGHFGHQSLKLAINALYGKLAQGIGYRGRAPAYRSYVWAGWITAMCRAQMMELASPDVVMICTDGIYFDRDPGIRETVGLGGLEFGKLSDCFIAQPGIYEGKSEEGEVKRSRGVFAREIKFDDLRVGYAARGPYYISSLESTRFVGLGSAMVLRDFRTWRTWQERERKITLYPSRKFIKEENERPTIHVPPRAFDGQTLSAVYDPKRRGMDAPGMLDWIQALEQPLREEEQ